jgi:sialic acid synthase SpsE
LKSEVKVGPHTIGPGHPLYLMAECGVTCNYDLAMTRELIDVVREAGAQAIKLILWFPDEIMADRSVLYTYKAGDGTDKTVNMFEMLNGLRFTFDEWQKVKEHADARGVTLFATVNSPSGIEWSERLGLPAYKLSSWDYNYTWLWRTIARLRKPMLMDTGPVWMHELADVLHMVEQNGADECVLVHTVHTETPAEINMRTIPFLAHAFGTPAGFSATDERAEMDITAIALGAGLIEKRLTMRRTLPGHHHALSMEPRAFIEWAATMRDVQASLGRDTLIPSPSDLSERKRWFRHLVAAQDIDAGAVLSDATLTSKRGEFGVSPVHQERFVGRRLRRAIKRDEALRWDDI